MKILVVNTIYYLPVSGINRVIDRLGEELLKKGHEYTIVALSTDHTRKDEMKNGFHVIRLPKTDFWIGGESLSIVPFLIKNLKNYDCVHIHSYYSSWSLIASLVCRLYHKPSIFIPYYHGVEGPKKGLFRIVYRIFSVLGQSSFRWADRTICVSDHEKSLVEEAVVLPEEKLMVVPVGVDRIIASGAAGIARHPEISMLYVGNLLEYKGVQYAIESIRILKERYGRDARLTIVGDGEYRASLEALAAKTGSTDSVYFYSHLARAELDAKYRASDILVLLSNSESYGLVVAEALAMGKPCIVADTTALSEFTREPGCFGIRYPPDPAGLARLIIRIHDDGVKVGPLSDKVRTWEKVAESYELLSGRLVCEGTGDRT
jgi:glycosyltransferase involved in cell wall biosynthesis